MKKVNLVFLIPALASCAPLQQAPLVYSSKLVIGVDISSSPGDATSFSANLGVKALDAAYVPVAVSKDGKVNCVTTKDQNNTEKEVCRYNPQNIQLIRADHGTNYNEHSASDAEGEPRNDSTKNILEKIGNKPVDAPIDSNEIAKLPESYKSEIIDASGLEISTVTANYNKMSTTEKDQVNALYKKLISNKSDAEKKEVSKDILGTQSGPELLDGAIKTTEAGKRKAKMLGASNADTSNDALSVYGKFQSNSEGGSNSAGLTAGKIFSTGIAAQNLTAAAKLDSIGGCIEKITAAANLIKDQNEKAKFLSNVSICGRQKNDQTAPIPANDANTPGT